MTLPLPLLCFSLFLIISTLIPLIRHDYWIFRIFEYPRLQKLILNLIVILIITVWYMPENTVAWIVLAALFLNLLYLCYQVYPFTILGTKQIVKSRNPPGDNNVRLLIANVYQENRRAADYHRIIDQCNPDLILLVETNLWWQKQMDSISSDYPHQLKIPLENTYGMILYSRFELENGQVNFLVEDDIPSIEVDVRLRSGVLIRLFCLHPQPPVPQENPRSTERDKEILMIAKKAKKCAQPVIVIGDLNDVAWSYTTELFSKISGLLDPRRGRGFFNSFNAKYFFLRFPLDHIFCSTDFTLTSIQRLESCGSDHFPMCADLQFDSDSEARNEAPVADQEDKELAEEKLAKPIEIF
ncbi:endonuclease/exonuclease/phosphatase family protein [Pedobacter antarcticus]|uniref:Endonuclease n=2 Tax=Pedobacter antarcticus TaxID=34086 RepID=A0A081PBT4_9SPHI|nr:endonuclease/exonuclease/phosphatase family protein [Pedobacter antarcticus]KEQ28157.1 endonuclease [Pedobacter antarcticus 4BY]